MILDTNGDEAGKPTAKGYFAEDSQTGSREGGFRSQDALVNAVGDPRYASDAEYRRVAQEVMTRTDGGIIAGSQPREDGRLVERMAVESEWLTEQMAKPEYRTSALFRRQVADHIARSQSAVRHVALGSAAGCHRVSMGMNESVAPMGVTRATASDNGEGDN